MDQMDVRGSWPWWYCWSCLCQLQWKSMSLSHPLFLPIAPPLYTMMASNHPQKMKSALGTARTLAFLRPTRGHCPSCVTICVHRRMHPSHGCSKNMEILNSCIKNFMEKAQRTPHLITLPHWLAQTLGKGIYQISFPVWSYLSFSMETDIYTAIAYVNRH